MRMRPLLTLEKRAVGNGINFCDTTKKSLPKTNPPYKRGIFLYHRSGDKPLDPTTLLMNKASKSAAKATKFWSPT